MHRPTHRTIMLTVPLLALPILATACAGSQGGTTVSRVATPAVTATPAATTPAASATAAGTAFAGLESRFQARLGVYAVDTGSGRTVSWNAGQRFAFCSTYKALATGMLLQRDTSAQLGQVI